MRSRRWAPAALLACATLAIATTSAWADAPGARDGGPRTDNLPNPLAEKQFALRQAALRKLLTGRAAANGGVVRVADGEFAQVAQTETDLILTVLAEFGGPNGPLHNQIPEPPPQDNTTLWVPDFNRSHYLRHLFAKRGRSMTTFYTEQSSGRFTVDGDITDWVTVPGDEARYGNNSCGSSVCTNVWGLIRESLKAWVADRHRAGWSTAQIRGYLQKFDVWDRYDHDGDGNFDEPDGYIDHFQNVHAGEGEEVGGGAQGEDAIWSHRWYANIPAIGVTGPPGNKLGGFPFPGTGIWVGDYTMEPENGDLGVFVHEFAHDLGLPDEYDVLGPGEAPTGFWTEMSQGTYLNDGRTLGNLPAPFSAWDKLQLGWLDHATTRLGQTRTVTLGPAQRPGAGKQAVVTVLGPQPHRLFVTRPFAGDSEWWGGFGSNLQSTLTHRFDLSGASSAAVALKAWYEIETGFDYLYAEVSTDGGSTWTAVPGTVNGEPIGTDGAVPALTGSSVGWVNVRYGLSRYAGKAIRFRFRYATDVAIVLRGFAADQIRVVADGRTVFFDGAESGTRGWAASGGFRQIGGTYSKRMAAFYLAENRRYVGYDRGLRTGPYQFTSPTSVHAVRFPYQDGLLVWLWDPFWEDNSVSIHPGRGLILPFDSHPVPLRTPAGDPWRSRIQVYDATFGHQATDPIQLPFEGRLQRIPSHPPVAAFDDRRTYWYPAAPDAGVKGYRTGTIIRVLEDGPQMRVLVTTAH